MDDRELLEMAAKSINRGIRFRALTNMPGAREVPSLLNDDGTYTRWDPLESDGDAFRLALKLQIKIEYAPEMDSVICSLPGSQGGTSVAAIGDVELRYAIVKAAAQLGLTL